MMQQCNKEEGFRMNSSGSSGIDRTSSEESDVVPSRTGDSSPASDEFDFSSSSVRQAKTSVPAFFFPPISTNKSGSGVQSNGIKRKNSSPAESRMTPFASAAIATVNKIADRLGRLQKIERESVESEVITGSNKSNKKSKQHSSGSTGRRNSDQPTKKGGATEAEQALIAEVLRMVAELRQSTLSNVPTKHRQEVVDENTRTDSSTEYAILLGRCFNLSMNLKILSQSTVLDPNLAGRVISDLSLLENSMVERRDKKEEIKSDLVVSSLFGGLKLDKIRNAGGRPRFGFL